MLGFQHSSGLQFQPQLLLSLPLLLLGLHVYQKLFGNPLLSQLQLPTCLDLLRYLVIGVPVLGLNLPHLLRHHGLDLQELLLGHFMQPLLDLQPLRLTDRDTNLLHLIQPWRQPHHLIPIRTPDINATLPASDLPHPYFQLVPQPLRPQHIQPTVHLRHNREGVLPGAVQFVGERGCVLESPRKVGLPESPQVHTVMPNALVHPDPQPPDQLPVKSPAIPVQLGIGQLQQPLQIRQQLRRPQPNIGLFLIQGHLELCRRPELFNLILTTLHAFGRLEVVAHQQGRVSKAPINNSLHVLRPTVFVDPPVHLLRTSLRNCPSALEVILQHA